LLCRTLWLLAFPQRVFGLASVVGAAVHWRQAQESKARDKLSFISASEEFS